MRLSNPSTVEYMPPLNIPSIASHSAKSQRTCLAARNQPQDTEDSFA